MENNSEEPPELRFSQNFPLGGSSVGTGLLDAGDRKTDTPRRALGGLAPVVAWLRGTPSSAASLGAQAKRRKQHGGGASRASVRGAGYF